MKASFNADGAIHITIDTLEERIILENMYKLHTNGSTIVFVKDGQRLIASPQTIIPPLFNNQTLGSKYGVVFTPEHVKTILEFLTQGSKLGAVKYVKEVTGLGLKEAKELVDEFPVILNQQDLQKQYVNVTSLLNNGGVVFTNHDVKTILTYLANGEKLMAVKYVKEVTGIGLKEAKELVDEFPNVNKNRM